MKKVILVVKLGDYLNPATEDEVKELKEQLVQSVKNNDLIFVTNKNIRFEYVEIEVEDKRED
jgi:cobalamin biosynthesis Co2+ chelatase CbiK